MSTIAPNALYGMYSLLAPYLPTLKRGGVVGDLAHIRTGGYHISREDLVRNGMGGDYSVQAPADKRGPANAATAIDLTLSASEMKLVTARLRAACTPDQAGDYDDRIEPLREFIGTLDGRNVCGYNRYRTGRAVGWYPSGYSDGSHTWHCHLSFFRAYGDDKNAVAGVAEVVAGLRPGALGWRDPSEPAKPVVTPPKPVVTAPKPSAPSTSPPKDEEPPVPPEPTPDPKPSAEFVIELDAPGGGNWQGAIRTKNYWYMAEAIKRSDGSEDCLIHRFDLDGRYLDKMTLDADKGVKVHPTGWGVSDSGVIWQTWNDDAEGNDVITCNYLAGTTIRKSACQEMRVFSNGNVQISFDDTRDWATLRVITSGYDTHTLRRKADILDGVDKPEGKPVKIKRSATRVVQGFSVYRRHLYVLVGLTSAGSKFRVEKWSFDTGEKVGEFPIGETHGLKAKESGKVEPEGMDGLLFGMKVMTGAKRRLRIYQLRDF